MLPKQLKSLYEDLQEINQPNAMQSRLLSELEFIDENEIIAKEFMSYTYLGTLKESFSVAVGRCPVCGKKY
jgi:hypothetical protein